MVTSHRNYRPQQTQLNTDIQAFLQAAGPGPKAIFCSNGVAALACTQVLRELNCRLFEDVGLIALDDLDWFALVGSGITADRKSVV